MREVINNGETGLAVRNKLNNNFADVYRKAANIVGNSQLTQADDNTFLSVTSAGYVRLPETTPADGWFVRIAKAFAGGSVAVQNAAAAELDTLTAEGEWLEVQHLSGGTYRIYSFGPILRQLAQLAVPFVTSRLVYSPATNSVQWVAESSVATGTIVGITVNNGTAIVEFSDEITSVELADFAITATLDDTPTTLTGLSYNHVTRTITFTALAQASASQTLAIALDPASESTVLTGGTASGSVVIVGSSVSGFTGDTTLNTGLAHGWLFESDATDAIGSANGTLSEPAPAFTAAKNGNGQVMTGSQFSQMAAANLPALGNGTADNPFSLSFWFNASNTNSEILISQATGATNGIWDIAKSTSGGQFILRLRLFDDSNSARITVATGGLATATVYHLVATYDASEGNAGMRLYINGVNVSTSRDSTGTYVAMEALALNLLVGARNPAVPALQFNGWIDELYLWQRELTAAEVVELYAAGAGKFVE